MTLTLASIQCQFRNVIVQITRHERLRISLDPLLLLFFLLFQPLKLLQDVELVDFCQNDAMAGQNGFSHPVVMLVNFYGL